MRTKRNAVVSYTNKIFSNVKNAENNLQNKYGKVCSTRRMNEDRRHNTESVCDTA